MCSHFVRMSQSSRNALWTGIQFLQGTAVPYGIWPEIAVTGLADMEFIIKVYDQRGVHLATTLFDEDLALNSNMV